MAKLPPPPPTTQTLDSRQWRDWLYSIYALINQGPGGLGTMAYQNANAVAITGGNIGGVGISGSTIDNTPIGNITPSTGVFTSLKSYGTTVKLNQYIEAYDTSSSIALTSTPTILAPASTGGSAGLTYNSSTGVFTFPNEGDFSLSLTVNAIASASGQFVYIFAQNNTGAGWVTNINSGKYFELTNAQVTQIVYSQSVHRVAGQQVRYYIYSNDGKVSLTTTSLPSTTAIVPAIRIQYA